MHNITIACGAITAKLGQIVIYFPPAQHCKGAGWTDVIIALLICLTFFFLAFFITKSILKLKTTKTLQETNEELSKKLKKEKEKNDETHATYRSKILEYIENETTYCKRLHQDLCKQKEKEDNLIEQLQKVCESLKDKTILNEKDVTEITKSLEELKKTIASQNRDQLIGEVKTLFDRMKKQKSDFSNNAYLIALNAFLKGGNIDSLLGINQQSTTTHEQTSQNPTA